MRGFSINWMGRKILCGILSPLTPGPSPPITGERGAQATLILNVNSHPYLRLAEPARGGKCSVGQTNGLPVNSSYNDRKSCQELP